MRGLRACRPPLYVAIVGLFICLFSVSGILVVLFGLLDALGRYRDYRHLVRTYPRGLPIHIVNHFGKSYCGRNVVETHHPSWALYYEAVGYRWYHVLPDGFPRVIFHRRFWRNLIWGHKV